MKLTVRGRFNISLGERNAGAIYATAFACLIAFMGIGVVDPILPIIGNKMGATSAQVELLFTSYIAIMALAMLIAGPVSTHLRAKRTMALGLGLVVIFATLSGLSNSIPELAVVRGGWGLGNALFTPTALVVIIGLASNSERAVTFYEAALGLGISTGPLLGGILGDVSWRLPFFGTALLMLIAFSATIFTVREPERREKSRGILDTFRPYRNGPFLIVAVTGMLYSFCFFVMLAYSPLFLRLSAIQLGLTFFAWGILVGISSVWLVNKLLPKFTVTQLILGGLVFLLVDFGAIALIPGAHDLKIALVILSGLFMGLNNAAFTMLSVEVSPFTRSIAVGAYNFVRWGGAAIAPVLSGVLADRISPATPYLVGTILVAVACILLLFGAHLIEDARRQNAHPKPESQPAVAAGIRTEEPAV